MKTDDKGNEIYRGHTLVKKTGEGRPYYTIKKDGLVLATEGTREDAREFVKKRLGIAEAPKRVKTPPKQDNEKFYFEQGKRVGVGVIVRGAFWTALNGITSAFPGKELTKEQYDARRREIKDARKVRRDRQKKISNHRSTPVHYRRAHS